MEQFRLFACFVFALNMASLGFSWISWIWPDMTSVSEGVEEPLCHHPEGNEVWEGLGLGILQLDSLDSLDSKQLRPLSPSPWGNGPLLRCSSATWIFVHRNRREIWSTAGRQLEAIVRIAESSLAANRIRVFQFFHVLSTGWVLWDPQNKTRASKSRLCQLKVSRRWSSNRHLEKQHCGVNWNDHMCGFLRMGDP